MDFDRDITRGDYRFTDRHRELLFENLDYGTRDTAQAAEIRERAGNLPVRIQHLIEDVTLLSWGGVLDRGMRPGLKMDLESLEPPIERRVDSVLLEDELGRSEVSSFGMAVGHMLSHIYPGDPTEHARLWRGMALGYFGHPRSGCVHQDALAESGDSGYGDSTGSRPCHLFGWLQRQFREQEETSGEDGIDSVMYAEQIVTDLQRDFGRILLREFSDGVPTSRPLELPDKLLAVVLASVWSGETHDILRGMYRSFLESEAVGSGEEASVIDAGYPGMDESLLKRTIEMNVDLDYLEELDVLCRCLEVDSDRVEEQGFLGTGLIEVYACLGEADATSSSVAVADELGAATNIVTKLLNDLAGRGTSEREWAGMTPARETSDGYRLNSYGRVLGYVLFESEQPFAEIYSVAMAEEIREFFNVSDALPSLVEAVPTDELDFDGDSDKKPI